MENLPTIFRGAFMSAFETLIADHRKVAELFSQAEATEDEKTKTPPLPANQYRIRNPYSD